MLSAFKETYVLRANKALLRLKYNPVTVGTIQVILGVPGSGKTQELVSIVRSLRKSHRVVGFTFTRGVRLELSARGIPMVRSFAGWAQSAVQTAKLGHVYPPEHTWHIWRRAWIETLGGECPEKYSPWYRTQYDCVVAKDVFHYMVHVFGSEWAERLEAVAPDVARVAQNYVLDLQTRNAMDHDLAMLTVIEMQIYPPYNPERKELIYWVYVVDEAQDLSPLMIGMLRLWGVKNIPTLRHFRVDPIVELADNSMVIFAGDPAQSIYSTLHGASPLFLNLVAEVAANEVRTLTFSKRCPSKVARAANMLRVFTNVSERTFIKMYGRSEEGFVKRVDARGDLIESVVDAVSALVRNVGPAIVFVITHRDNTVVEIAKALALRGIPPCSVKVPNPLHVVDADLGERLTQICHGWRDGIVDYGKGRVSVVVDTVHAVKGLEADYVIYVPDPVPNAGDYEVHRYAYVAVTRAIRGVYVFCFSDMEERLSWLCDIAED